MIRRRPPQGGVLGFLGAPAALMARPGAQGERGEQREEKHPDASRNQCCPSIFRRINRRRHKSRPQERNPDTRGLRPELVLECGVIYACIVRGSAASRQGRGGGLPRKGPNLRQAEIPSGGPREAGGLRRPPAFSERDVAGTLDAINNYIQTRRSASPFS